MMDWHFMVMAVRCAPTTTTTTTTDAAVMSGQGNQTSARPERRYVAERVRLGAIIVRIDTSARSHNFFSPHPTPLSFLP